MRKEFKITNHKRVRVFISIILLVLLFNVLLIFFCLNYPLKKTERIVSLLIILTGICYLLIKLFRIKFFEIESSGMVCSIKIYPVLKNSWIAPVLEFPLDVLSEFSYRGNFLCFKLKKNNDFHIVGFYVIGLTKKQNRLIKEKLSNI